MPETEFEIGQCLRLRRRHWLVESVESALGLPNTLRIACLDDDAQGAIQRVIPDCELGIERVDDDAWRRLGAQTPSDAKAYSAYLQSLQWNTATAADNNLFQAPFRAGIEISAYQLAPLAKALDLPRVNLLIADDVGLGKTIEAGLVLRELMLRRKVDFLLVAAPAGMTQQWQEELSSKFGLKATIVDQDYFAGIRAQRGFAYNPWNAANAYIISHRLLIDPAYTDGLHAVLADPRPRSLLILDEAHHVAPAHGEKYAVDSQLTRSMRELARRFEHRLFLTATPHNGHSNSFTALLEMLDPQRFVRGIDICQEDHDKVMVRRLKSDLKDLTDIRFPTRVVEPITLLATADEAPELRLSDMLLQYIDVAKTRGYGFVRLQQRLLSSVAAFKITLEKEIAEITDDGAKTIALEMLAFARERSVKADEKSKALADWIRRNMGQGSKWNERRLIVFTEFEDTLDWLHKQLLEELKLEDGASRIATYLGATPRDDRERLKARFNSDPDEEPLRILLCTDAAREGINLQHRCYDLFHFDLPWNPSRLEQRNGRIDRRLQPMPEVFCRYFIYKHRASDRILDALVRKTERINRELGEVGPVLADAVESRLSAEGITPENAASLADDLESEAYLEAQRRLEELRLTPERTRRRKKLQEDLNALERRLEASRKKKDVAPAALQSVFLGALQKIGADIPHDRIEAKNGVDVISIPPDAAGFQNADWTSVFDDMRDRPPHKGETIADYRKNAALKRVSFNPVKEGERVADKVEHLHLEHRLVKRLLSQYEAQGFRAKLERTAVFSARVDRPRVVLLARLTLYAKGANSLHSQLIPLTATVTNEGVSALKSDGRTALEVLQELQGSIENARQAKDADVKAYRRRAPRDALALKPLLEAIAVDVETQTRLELEKNGEEQALSLQRVLVDQKRALTEKMKGRQLELQLPEEIEQRQLDEQHWQKRLAALDDEIAKEPDLVRERYRVTARRLEPVGLIYLLPERD